MKWVRVVDVITPEIMVKPLMPYSPPSNGLSSTSKKCHPSCVCSYVVPLLVMSLALLVFGTMCMLLKPSPCPEGWIQYDMCYYLGEETETWANAKRICVRENADLLDPSARLNMKLRESYWTNQCWTETWRHKGKPYNESVSTTCLSLKDGYLSLSYKNVKMRFACSKPLYNFLTI